MNTYKVKSIFKTIQGEGHNAGRVSVFVRFAGCNLWTGREPDRINAICSFCDTDFIGTDGNGGGRYDAACLARYATQLWGDESRRDRFCVLTGGEPTLQVDPLLLDALHRFGFTIAIETNGTRPVPSGVDWITVSPKPAPIVQTKGNELKLVYPQELVKPDQFINMQFEYFYIQPMDGRDSAMDQSIQYCLDHPQWRLSCQVHKFVGLP